MTTFTHIITLKPHNSMRKSEDPNLQMRKSRLRRLNDLFRVIWVVSGSTSLLIQAQSPLPNISK